MTITMFITSKKVLLETNKPLMTHCFVDIDVEYATPILMSLSWIFSIPNNSIVLNYWEPWLAIKFKSPIEFVVHPAFFHPYYLLLSHLHYGFWENSDDIESDRDNNEGVSQIGFDFLGDNMKVFYKQERHYWG